MNIVFRVDASITIGTGHVMRCRTLATALKKKGAHIKFFCREHVGHLGDVLSRDGFAVTLLPVATETESKGNIYASWLGVSQKEDAEQTISALQNERCDWLIVDHYGLDHIWETSLRAHTISMMVIDDLANRLHDCDVLLDQNYSVTGQERYRSYVSAQCQLLLGPRYALLRSEYAIYSKTKAPHSGNAKRVLVYLGGSDNANVTLKVLVALSAEEFAHVAIDIVVGPNFIHKAEVIRQAGLMVNTQVHNPRLHLADLMANADLAIGAGGATMWERLCMDLPSLVLSIAENQEPACEALAAAGNIWYLGAADEVEIKVIESALVDLLVSDRPAKVLGVNNKYLVDGLGVNRVVEILSPSALQDIALRPANPSDGLFCFSWARDNEITDGRADASQGDLVPYLASFDQQLLDINCHLYILESGGLPMGQIRFERIGTEATVAYSLDHLVRGRGWSNHLLMLGIEAFNSSRPMLLKSTHAVGDTAMAVPFIQLHFQDRLAVPRLAGRLGYSIAMVTDKNSWINSFLPKLLANWLGQGHRVLWTHRVSNLQSADFCFYLSFSQIVPKNVLSLFGNNLVVHESDLPQGKGWSPVTWQILEGKNKLPVTLIEAAEKVDSGAIYAQECIQFEGHELVTEIRRKQASATINLCKRFVDDYPGIIDDQKCQVGTESFYPRRKPSDSVLDVDASLKNQFNLLRTVDNSSYPAFFEYLGCRYEVHIVKQTVVDG